MLTDRRLCVYVELETHFIFQQSSRLIRRDQAPRSKNTRACEKVALIDAGAVVLEWSIPIVVALETTMSHFWAIF
jgi:hypothetical protein